MRLERASFRSKLARRVFFLFAVTSLAPLVVLATLAFRYMAGVSLDHAKVQLNRSSKTLAMSVLERLLLLQTEMQVVGANLDAGLGVRLPESVNLLRGRNEQRFSSVARIDEAGQVTPLVGIPPSVQPFSPAQLRHLQTGRSLVVVQAEEDADPRILFIRSEEPQAEGGPVLVAEVEHSFLWGGYDTASTSVGVCVVDTSGEMLFCPVPLPLSVRQRLVVDRQSVGEFEWSWGDATYLGSYWSLPLQYRFGNEEWIVVHTQARDDVLAPIARFRRQFTLVIVATLLLTVLVSVGLIRRTLDPIRQLREATDRVSHGNFEGEVRVAATDELGELADAFNMMAARLAQQFQMLAALSEIERGVPSAADEDEIIAIVLKTVFRLTACDKVAFCLLADDHHPEGKFRVHLLSDDGTEVLAAGGDDFDADHPRYLEPGKQRMRESASVPFMQRVLADRGCKIVTSTPLLIDAELVGIIGLGYSDSDGGNPDDRSTVRRVADQSLLALANRRLLAEQEELESQLRQNQKLESIGRLASGVAHDFNNILACVKGYAQLGLLEPEDTARITEFLQKIDVVSEKGSALVQHLLAFSRQQPRNPVVLDLSAQVQDTATMLRRLISDGIDLELQLEGDDALVQVDPNQLDVVLFNLVANARDAISGPGRILIATAEVAAADAPVVQREPAEVVGGWVVLTVADDGSGMSDETRQRIFDPFFTTKDIGSGTGLGLSTVYGIVEQHGGHIVVESELGEGTRFQIYLPAVRRLEEDRR